MPSFVLKAGDLPTIVPLPAALGLDYVALATDIDNQPVRVVACVPKGARHAGDLSAFNYLSVLPSAGLPDTAIGNVYPRGDNVYPIPVGATTIVLQHKGDPARANNQDVTATVFVA